jgi:5-methyltetrahydrofolate--homocysteine methyltransferase
VASYHNLCMEVVNGDLDKVKDLAKSLVDSGANPLEIINEGLIAGMNIVGPRFKNGEMFVPEVLMSAKAMSAGLEIVKSVLNGMEIPSIGTVIIGTVKGDLHDIGKNLVAMMLESSGFKVINLGVDLSAEQFAQAIKEYNPEIVAMSALLTTTMMQMRATIELLIENGLRDKVKVVIGGAPISQQFADQIGADGYAPDAASATDLCKQILA